MTAEGKHSTPPLPGFVRCLPCGGWHHPDFRHDKPAALAVALRERMTSIPRRDRWGYEVACGVVAEQMADGDPVVAQRLLDEMGVR